MEEGIKIAVEQLEPYVQKHNRSAESLLAAYRITRDRAYLREAMEKYPDDPRVCLDAYFQTAIFDREQSTPEQIHSWLSALTQAAPDNALGNYLAAAEYFKSGQPELALQELQVAGSKPRLTDYSVEYAYLAEEAYRAAGCSEAEAKAAGFATLPLAHLAVFKQLTQELTELANRYQQAGDLSAAYAVVEMAYELGRRMDQPDSRCLITQMVGNTIQRYALKVLDPSAQFGSTGLTVKDQLDLLEQRRQTLRELARASAVLETLPDQDVIMFFDRTKLFGEEAALRWLQSVYAPLDGNGQT